MKYRPWGSVKPMLALGSKKEWHFVGCLGTEERSLCAWMYLQSLDVISSQIFAQIFDVDSEKYRDMNAAAFSNRKEELISQRGSLSVIRSFHLMEERYQILSWLGAPESVPESVILDISSFPKRFFFLLLKSFVKNPRVKNLLITYSAPSSYADDAPLYEDIGAWQCLPGFGWIGDEKQKPDSWIVSIGFLVESLRREIIDSPPRKLKILIPFPAPLSVLKRSRKSLVDLEDGLNNVDAQRIERYRVDTLDLPSGFDRICSLTDNPVKSVVFAPFGPKPAAAAMCLYAMQRENSSSVMYPQPTIYHPEYSKGIRDDNPESAVSAYWIKYEGDFLYEI